MKQNKAYFITLHFICLITIFIFQITNAYSNPKKFNVKAISKMAANKLQTQSAAKAQTLALAQPTTIAPQLMLKAQPKLQIQQPTLKKKEIFVGFKELNEFFHSSIYNYIDNLDSLQGIKLNYDDDAYFNISTGIKNGRLNFKNANNDKFKINNYLSEFFVFKTSIVINNIFRWSFNLGFDNNHLFSEDSTVLSKKDNLFVGHLGTNLEIKFSDLFESNIGYLYTSNLNTKLKQLNKEKLRINNNTLFLIAKHKFIIADINKNIISFFIKEGIFYNSFQYETYLNNKFQTKQKASTKYFSGFINLGIEQNFINLFDFLSLNMFAQLKFENTLNNFSETNKKRINYFYAEIGLKMNLYKYINTLVYFSRELKYKKNNNLMFQINFEI